MSEKNDLLLDGPADAEAIVVLAHGAGAGSDTPFMQAFADGLAAAGLQVARFEFPYMQQRRATGSRRPPDRLPVLLETWRQVIEQLAGKRLIIGGKSMGGRIASLIADEVAAAGLVCLGYPFHPAGKPDRLRVEHLHDLQTPALFLQGERDPLGNRQEVEQYELSSSIRLHWLTDGDHSYKPRKASGRTQQQNWDEALEAIVDFLAKLD